MKDQITEDESVASESDFVKMLLLKTDGMPDLVEEINGTTAFKRQFMLDSLMPDLVKSLQEKIGTVDESRFIYPEFKSGDVPRMFSSLEYVREGEKTVATKHAAGSVVGAAALVAGTTVGAGILALPSATIASGFIPSTFAMLSAYVYMTMSGLLVAELCLNRMGQTGRPGMGLLDLYDSSLGKAGSVVGTGSYFFLHYAMMVAYIAQGGKDVEQILGWDQYGSIAFAGIMCASLFLASNSVVEKVNNGMVLGVVASFLSIVAIGAQTADFTALLDVSNQHPEKVVSCLPIVVLSLVYQNVVPTVVTNLEGDRSKITKAIVGGTTLPLIMFLAWNAVCLGNAFASGADLSQVNPVELLKSGEAGGTFLPVLVTAFSTLALVTSLIGFTYGLIDAWTDQFNIPLKGEKFETWKPALYSLVFAPPLLMSLTNPDIFYKALEYGGAFGVSTLFLVLPPLMVWKERYRDTDKPLMTEPMVPFGKLPLASMWKLAATLIVEHTAEQLGVFDWIAENWESWT
ncbi:hypothetical protein ACA910_011019 [Epithemia clementina (nom. ined.)]